MNEIGNNMIMILNIVCYYPPIFKEKANLEKKTRNQTVFVEKFGRLNLIIYFCKKFSVVFVKIEKMGKRLCFYALQMQ